MGKYIFLLMIPFLSSCMKWGEGTEEDISLPKGLFIVNEGNFQYGNATLSFYDPRSGLVENEVFSRANAMKLGDTAQSMTFHTDSDGQERGWIVVNNSHVIFSVDPSSLREAGRITGLTSPRYIHFLSDTKAYVSQLWDNRITVVNPRTYSITGYIACPGMTSDTGSTEQMVQIGRYVYVACWSHQDRILKVDTESDTVIGECRVGLQPTSLVVDCNGMIWTITDGGYEGSPTGCEAPRISMVNPETMTVERSFELGYGTSPSAICIDGDGRTLYWIEHDIWSMDISSASLPATPTIESRSTIYYGLSVDPDSGEIYVADAIDYEQQGIIYRYSSLGEEIDRFYTGVTPGSFCWRR